MQQPAARLQEVLDELVTLVEGARALPLSSSAVVDRGQVLERLAEARRLLPVALAAAERLTADRDAVLEQARAEAAELLEQTKRECRRRLSQSEVFLAAEQEAQRLLEDAEQQAEAMQNEVDDYVDAKLATFEIVLHKTLAAVERGRAKLAGHSELDALAPE